MNRAAEFAAFCKARAMIESELAQAGAALRAIPGVGSGPMGLTPDSVKFSPEFRAAKARHDIAFAALRRLNGHNVKRFAAELRQEREAARAAMLARP